LPDQGDGLDPAVELARQHDGAPGDLAGELGQGKGPAVERLDLGQGQLVDEPADVLSLAVTAVDGPVVDDDEVAVGGDPVVNSSHRGLRDPVPLKSSPSPRLRDTVNG